MTQGAPAIRIVGLGPGDPSLRTLATQRALDAADQIVLRTRVHPGLDALCGDPRVSDCDDLYQTAAAFDSLYEAIADRVLARAEAGPVVYAVPGHPRFAERTVPLIVARARSAGIPCEVLDAVSFLDTTIAALGADPIADGMQLVDAEWLASIVDAEPFSAGQLALDPTRPILVAQVYNREMAAAAKIALSRIIPDEHTVTLVTAAGIPGQQSTKTLKLHELDRQEVAHLTSLWVPPLAPLGATRSPQTLTRIVARLRAPGGCPWDREQSHPSLREAIIEEAYETVDAIDDGDMAGLAEELGDLVLLVAMQAQIAEEEGSFRIEDVYDEVSRKLVRRHPHVFGEIVAETPDAVIATWEGVKAAERAANGAPPVEKGPYDRLPRAMPPLRKAIEVLAPRATLRGPSDADEGSTLLQAVETLLAQGVDPERALEDALRSRAAQGDSSSGSEEIEMMASRGEVQA
jgi:tetrapyrrole methylase family protein/MazG family protein